MCLSVCVCSQGRYLKRLLREGTGRKISPQQFSKTIDKVLEPELVTTAEREQRLTEASMAPITCCSFTAAARVRGDRKMTLIPPTQLTADGIEVGMGGRVNAQSLSATSPEQSGYI